MNTGDIGTDDIGADANDTNIINTVDISTVTLILLHSYFYINTGDTSTDDIVQDWEYLRMSLSAGHYHCSLLAQVMR